MTKNREPMHYMTTDLTDVQFNKVKDLIYRECGIFLKSGKEALVRARLTKRLRALRMGSFGEYLDYLENEGSRMELSSMIDVMTTNKTSFFREIDHFHFMRDSVLPKLGNRRIRLWTAGCSSGEEPYTLAMVLFRIIGGYRTKRRAHPCDGHFHSNAETNRVSRLLGRKAYEYSQIPSKPVFRQDKIKWRGCLSIKSQN